MKLLIAVIVILISTLVSCQKYEDGPLISFRSPEKRLVKKWTLVETLIDGETQENYFWNGSTLTFSSSNEFLFFRISDSAEWKGQWQLLNDKTLLNCNGNYYSAAGSIFSHHDEFFNIQKLTNKKLWLKTSVAGPLPPPYNEIEYHYIP